MSEQVQSAETLAEAVAEAKNKGVGLMRVVLGIGGLLAVVAGILVLVNPVSSATAVAIVGAVIFAIYMIVSGVAFIGGAIFSKTMGGWKRVGYGLLGALYIAAAVITFSNLRETAFVLFAFFVIFLGITWVLEGFMSFATLGQASSKVWAVIYGIISVIAGFVLAFSPLAGGLTLWWLFGFMLIAMGIAQVVTAFLVKAKN